MSITNEQKQAYLQHRRYFYAASPNNFQKPVKRAVAKEDKDAQTRQKKLLSYLEQAKTSAIKRGMYNQNTYKAMVAEAKNNV